MGDGDAQLSEHLALLLGEVGAMCHDGVLAQQTEIAQGVRVGLAEALKHDVVFPLAFVAVRLHVGARGAGQIAQAAQHLVGAAGDEARRDDGPGARAAAPPDGLHLADEGFGVAHRLLRRCVAVVVRVCCGVVHHRLAHKCALAALGADLGERHRCLQMRAAEVHRRGRPSRKKLIDQVGVHFLREIDIRELRLQRERALIEPPVERLVEGERRLRPLRRVDVDVHEAWQPESTLPQLKKHAGFASLRHYRGLVGVVMRDDALDRAVFPYFYEGALQVLEAAVFGRVEK